MSRAAATASARTTASGGSTAATPQVSAIRPDARAISTMLAGLQQRSDPSAAAAA
jgi:hypothetical protein